MTTHRTFDFLTIFALLATPAAFADSALHGTWTMSSMTCSSGAAYKGLDQGKGFAGKVEATANFDEKDLNLDFSVYLKYDRANDGNVAAQLEDALKSAQQQPEGPTKQKWIEELTSTLNTVKTYEAGVTCSFQETTPYTFDGKILHQDKPTRNSSSCATFEPLEAGQGDVIDSQVELNGDQLKLTAVNAETQDEGPCPKGDRLVTTFTRVPAPAAPTGK